MLKKSLKEARVSQCRLANDLRQTSKRNTGSRSSRSRLSSSWKSSLRSSRSRKSDLTPEQEVLVAESDVKIAEIEVEKNRVLAEIELKKKKVQANLAKHLHLNRELKPKQAQDPRTDTGAGMVPNHHL